MMHYFRLKYYTKKSFCKSSDCVDERVDKLLNDYFFILNFFNDYFFIMNFFLL